MLHNDSVEKVVTRYFATVAKEAFVFEGKTYVPKPLKVSPLLLRDYTCPPGCGGCCFKFTLDYLPVEPKPPAAQKRWVEFDGRRVEIWSDAQESNVTKRCQHLLRDGRCGIYTVRPFSCDFELIRTLQPVDAESPAPNVLTQKLFGRGWSYVRTDGGKGAKCEMLPVSPHSIEEVVRKLKRLKQWAEHFGVLTWVDDILRVVEQGVLQRSLSPIIFSLSKKGFGLE